MKRIFSVIALIAVFAFVFAGCGSKEEPAATAAQTVPELSAGEPLELVSSTLTAATWSSPNGATVNLTAVPNGYAEGQSAAFVVRLEGENVEEILCDWNGSAYTASADLNAADGYCYYVVLTAADGTKTEIDVNTPANPTDEALIDMAASLESYCNLTISSSEHSGSKLTITGGAVEVQAPRITNVGETVTCTEAILVLTFNEEETDRVTLNLSAAGKPGCYQADIAGTVFDVPAMEDDQQLSLRLDVTLSNGQALSAPGGTWSYLNGELISAVG